MKFRRIIGASLACFLVVVGLSIVWGQERDKSRTTVRSTERTRSSSTEVRSVSAVIGGGFVVDGGTRFGKVEDIVISHAGGIEFVVVGYEDRYYPIPWSVVSVNFSERVIAVDITRD